MKQVDENGKLITSLSEGNFELRKECSQKFNSDFDMYYEKFHYRPKAEILSLRGKNFEVGKEAGYFLFVLKTIKFLLYLFCKRSGVASLRVYPCDLRKGTQCKIAVVASQ